MAKKKKKTTPKQPTPEVTDYGDVRQLLEQQAAAIEVAKDFALSCKTKEGTEQTIQMMLAHCVRVLEAVKIAARPQRINVQFLGATLRHPIDYGPDGEPIAYEDCERNDGEGDKSTFIHDDWWDSSANCSHDSKKFDGNDFRLGIKTYSFAEQRADKDSSS